MKSPATIYIILGIFLILGVTITGCTDSSDTAASGTSDTTAPTTTIISMYTAGDIVRSASSSQSSGWLIIDYNSAGDTYTRALVNKKEDGTWYRISTATETSARAVMEKVYSVKVSHIDGASVPVAADTTLPQEITTIATRTTTSTIVATTTSSARPGIKSTDPEEGEAGTTVRVEITGNDFLTNLTALLRHTGKDSIKATTVSRTSSSLVTATFDIPNSTTVGTWDIVVTNPNGLSGELANYFVVRGNATAE
jgi:hypothetical protein